MIINWRYLHAFHTPLALLCMSIAALAVPGSAFAADASRAMQSRDSLIHPERNGMIVIAHRSCWKDTAENSLAAVRECIRLGVNGVEFDVHHSSDGVAVVIHDDTLERTTNGHGKVADQTLAQLKTLRLKTGKGGAGAALTDQQIPTLSEFLAATKDQLLLVFDVKDLTQEDSFAAAKSAGVEKQAIFFYECSNDLLLKHIRPFWNNVMVFPIAFDNNGSLSKTLSSCKSNPSRLAHVKFTRESFMDTATFKATGKPARIWVATMFPEDVAGHGDAEAVKDPDAHWGWLIRSGANMIMTNEPQALLAYLKRKP
jgi:glycerophosphoryl diester phosphodiesterase